MSRLKAPAERHLVGRIGWLRAAVLGANDGILSTGSLIVGVAAAATQAQEVLIAAVAAAVAGAMSMAAGEYVSVSSQADTENADLALEREELKAFPTYENNELAQIYVKRGLDHELAKQVADQLMKKDALGAHVRDELGINEISTAHPLQAAFTSAASFTAGAVMPLSVVLLSPLSWLIASVTVTSLASLAVLGAIGAKAGGAHMLVAAARVTFWGAMAMALTAGVGALIGGTVA